MTFRFTILASSLLLAACGGNSGAADSGLAVDSGRTRDSGTAGDASSASRVEIGGGIDAFEPFGPGTTAELVHGPQGGYHVQIAFRMWGIDPEGLLVQAHGYDATTGDEITIPAERVLTARRVSMEGDHLLRLGDRLIFNATDPTTIYDPATMTGTELRVTATLTPTSGDPVTAETTTTVVDLTP